MTYLFDFIKSLMKKNNIGIIAYLIINVFIITFIFSNEFTEFDGFLFGLGVYIISLAIALSPIGEWILRFQNGCKKLRDPDIKNRIQPLFDEVYKRAKEIDPSIPDGVELFICYSDEPNAFATGRKTICLNLGFLNYSDEEIKAVFAHELGHLAHKDTDLILLIAVGNLIITIFFVIYRFCMTIALTFIGMFSEGIFGFLEALIIDLILAGMMWLWTKLGVVLVMHSSRQNEYLADEFAAKCGYGAEMVDVLNTFRGKCFKKGLWASLAESHPEALDRIAVLKEKGLV